MEPARFCGSICRTGEIAESVRSRALGAVIVQRAAVVVHCRDEGTAPGARAVAQLFGRRQPAVGATGAGVGCFSGQIEFREDWEAESPRVSRRWISYGKPAGR